MWSALHSPVLPWLSHIARTIPLQRCTGPKHKTMLVACGRGEDGTEFSPFASVLGAAEAERCQAGHVALPALLRPEAPILCAPTRKNAARSESQVLRRGESVPSRGWRDIGPAGTVRHLLYCPKSSMPRFDWVLCPIPEGLIHKPGLFLQNRQHFFVNGAGQLSGFSRFGCYFDCSCKHGKRSFRLLRRVKGTSRSVRGDH